MSLPPIGRFSNKWSGPSKLPNFPALCQTFRDLESWTWRRIDSANRCGVCFGEETITESLLLGLAENHKTQLKIKAYTKLEEGKGTKATGNMPTGADWSFWIVDSNGQGVELRIQAKRQFSSGKYENLDGSGKQIADLWSNKGIAIPLYVLYNGPFVINSSGGKWSNFKCKASCEKKFRGQSCWGCSFVSLNEIPPKSAPYPTEIGNMHPWHCLVCKCGHSNDGNHSLAKKICSAANSAYKSGRSPRRAEFSGPDVFFEPHRTPPNWVSFLTDEGVGNERLNEFWMQIDLKGVAIIEELNEDDR